MSLTIPDSVTAIEEEAFAGCINLRRSPGAELPTDPNDDFFDYTMKVLKTFSIPGSVTYIGREAFRDCESLCIVSYNGSTERFKAILSDEPGFPPHVILYSADGHFKL
jgi:hypothetical protein